MMWMRGEEDLSVNPSRIGQEEVGIRFRYEFQHLFGEDDVAIFESVV